VPIGNFGNAACWEAAIPKPELRQITSAGVTATAFNLTIVIPRRQTVPIIIVVKDTAVKDTAVEHRHCLCLAAVIIDNGVDNGVDNGTTNGIG